MMRMFLAVRRYRLTLKVESRESQTGTMAATTVKYVNHAVLCMLPAVLGCLAAMDVEGRHLRAGITRATPATYVHHAVLGMFSAVGSLLLLSTLKYGVVVHG